MPTIQGTETARLQDQDLFFLSFPSKICKVCYNWLHSFLYLSLKPNFLSCLWRVVFLFLPKTCSPKAYFPYPDGFLQNIHRCFVHRFLIVKHPWSERGSPASLPFCACCASIAGHAHDSKRNGGSSSGNSIGNTADGHCHTNYDCVANGKAHGAPYSPLADIHLLMFSKIGVIRYFRSLSDSFLFISFTYLRWCYIWFRFSFLQIKSLV